MKQEERVLPYLIQRMDFNFEKCGLFLVKVVNYSTHVRYENL